MRHLRIRGTAADRSTALNRLHVCSEVLGVWEAESAFEVWLEGADGDDLPDLGDVVVAELDAAESSSATGLEDDGPIHVSDRLVVRPPWVPPLRDFAGVELVVPREMAFGSGEHGSTRAALECNMNAGAGTLESWAGQVPRHPRAVDPPIRRSAGARSRRLQ